MTDTVAAPHVASSADLETLKKHFGNREWRLDNLYHIQDEAGTEIKFVRNEAQLAYWRDLWYRNVILKARQLGFSTFIELVQLDTCLFNSNTTAGLIDYTIEDAKKKLAKISFAYERLPESIKGAVELITDSTTEMAFSNNSVIRVGTSHTGSTLQSLHVSELGRIASEFPDKAKDIKKGAFGTVHAGQMIHVESTARGSGGEFAELVQRADNMQKEKRELSPLDFRLHFFAWFRNPNYRLQVPVPINVELNEYFEEIEGKVGVTIDLHQRYWYAAMISTLGPDDIKSEYPSTPEECFFTSLEGAYFKRELSKARTDGRIGQRIMHDPSRRVNTFWDIGLDDETSIWFHQTDGVRHWFIDYYECSGEGAQHFAAILRKRADAQDYLYGVHYLPHDVEVREWGSNAKPRIEILKELNVKPIETVPAVDDKADAIEATRRFLNMCWFDSVRTERGVTCLDNYRKEWDDRRSVWRQKPLHDWASHASDALMTGVLGLVPEANPESRNRRRGFDTPKKSSWSA